MTPGHRLNRIIREQGLINAGFAKSIGVVQNDVSILTSGVSSAAGGDGNTGEQGSLRCLSG